jgi:ribonuclease HI
MDKSPAMDTTAPGLKSVTIYTDGACQGNPGPGGYGAVLMYGEHRRELSGGYRLTTNNRMELLGAIVALERLKFRCSVAVHSDSRYVVQAMEQRWAIRWRNDGWRTGVGQQRRPVANPDLWRRFVWVKGHAGDPENERADRLAVAAAAQPDLPPDEPYEEARSVPAMPGLFGPESGGPGEDGV